jgi:hypothetical protein
MQRAGHRRGAGSCPRERSAEDPTATATTWLVCLILVVGQARLDIFVSLLIPLTSCLAMAISQPDSPRDRRRLMWLAPVAMISVLPQSHGQAFNTVPIDALILGSALAVAIFPINPRLLVACAVVWTAIGVMPTLVYQRPETVPLLALSAPLMLLATTGRVVLARRRHASP